MAAGVVVEVVMVDIVDLEVMAASVAVVMVTAAEEAMVVGPVKEETGGEAMAAVGTIIADDNSQSMGPRVRVASDAA